MAKKPVLNIIFESRHAELRGEYLLAIKETMTMQFFFSLIIPVYNTEDYLPRCLNSVASQSFALGQVQVIVVDDGSPRTEDCEKIVDSYKGKLNIDYVKLPENKGLFVARKRGVEKVSGLYFLHLDPDDYLEKNALQALSADIQTNGEADYIEFNVSQLRRGRFKLKYSFLLPDDAKTNAIDIVYNDGGHQTRIFNKCFRTPFAKPIYEKMPEDYIFFAEDFYQTCTLDYFAKNRRIFQKYLYVYVLGTGITAEKTYSKDKLKKMLLSLSNIEKHLVEFYQLYEEAGCIEKAKNYSLQLYLWFLERSNTEDFLECCKEVLDEADIESLILQYLGRTTEIVREKAKRRSLSEMFAKLKRYLKRRYRKYLK